MALSDARANTICVLFPRRLQYLRTLARLPLYVLCPVFLVPIDATSYVATLPDAIFFSLLLLVSAVLVAIRCACISRDFDSSCSFFFLLDFPLYSLGGCVILLNIQLTLIMLAIYVLLVCIYYFIFDFLIGEKKSLFDLFVVCHFL